MRISNHRSSVSARLGVNIVLGQLTETAAKGFAGFLIEGNDLGHCELSPDRFRCKWLPVGDLSFGCPGGASTTSRGLVELGGQCPPKENDNQTLPRTAVKRPGDWMACKNELPKSGPSQRACAPVKAGRIIHEGFG